MLKYGGPPAGGGHPGGRRTGGHPSGRGQAGAILRMGILYIHAYAHAMGEGGTRILILTRRGPQRGGREDAPTAIARLGVTFTVLYVMAVAVG